MGCALRSEVVQAVGCLPCRQKDLNFILRIHIKKKINLKKKATKPYHGATSPAMFVLPVPGR